MIHALSHTTTDVVTGVTVASVDRFFFTCHLAAGPKPRRTAHRTQGSPIPDRVRTGEIKILPVQRDNYVANVHRPRPLARSRLTGR